MDIEDKIKEWEEECLKRALEKHPERRKEFKTVSGRPIRRIYTPADVKDKDFEKDIGFPGEYPFLRGIHPTMYRGRLWTYREFSGYGGPEETNERYKYLIKHGQKGLSVAFDMPTLLGYDSDAPIAKGEVGVEGVTVDSIRDMDIIFSGIDLGKITTSMTINAPAAIIWAMYIANAENHGVARAKLGGTIQNDILKEYIAQREWIFPPEPSMKLIVDTFEFGTNEVPLWNTISISGYHIREAGATAIQELAFTLADGFEYVKAGTERGLNVDSFAPRLSFFFNSHLDFFEEIAKLRAARRIWAREMKERFGAKNPRSWWMRFHAQNAGASLTKQQPLNNIIRTTIEALAAVLGGTQSLHCNSYDEALTVPSEKAVKIALRTQQIIAHESGVVNTVDPLAGSYFVETLTDEMEDECYEYFEKIEGMGGMIEAIKKGFPQREIAGSTYEFQKRVEEKDFIYVGVNEYEEDEEEYEEWIWRYDPEIARKQIKRLEKVRKERDGRRVKDILNKLQEEAENDRNLMPLLVEGSKALVTEGEFVDALKEVYGEHKEIKIL